MIFPWILIYFSRICRKIPTTKSSTSPWSAPTERTRRCRSCVPRGRKRRHWRLGGRRWQRVGWCFKALKPWETWGFHGISWDFMESANVNNTYWKNGGFQGIYSWSMIAKLVYKSVNSMFFLVKAMWIPASCFPLLSSVGSKRWIPGLMDKSIVNGVNEPTLKRMGTTWQWFLIHNVGKHNLSNHHWIVFIYIHNNQF